MTTPFRDRIVGFAEKYLSPALAVHIDSNIDDTATVIPKLVAIVLFIVLMLHLLSPHQSFFRRFRALALPISIFAMIYRFVSVFYLPKETIEHSMFDYMTHFLKNTFKVVVEWSDLHLSAQLSHALCTCFKDIIGLMILRATVTYVQSFRRTTFRELKDAFFAIAFNYAKMLPPVQSKLKEETTKMEKDLEHELKDPKRIKTETLPEKGRTHKSLLKEMTDRASIEDLKWLEGKVSGAVYLGDPKHTELMNAAYSAFSLSNPLHPDIWPSVNQFEAEVVAMVGAMLGGGSAGPCPTVCGSLTSGGTESIILAAKACRDYYCAKHSIKYPEIVSCTTAHAAIDKACDLLKIRSVKVPCDPVTFKIDVNEVKRAISADTIMIYSSAPSFPQGSIDDIAALSRVAIRHDVGLHVDCCLGGFVLPFAAELGYPLKPFDFALPGVTTISCDTHKYGYASKGTSVVLYRNKALRHAQYFCCPEWTGGLYVTPTIAGSRPGGLSAAAWASMMAMGKEGYMERTKKIMDTTIRIAEACQQIEGLKLMGGGEGGMPEAMIVAFGSDQYNVYRVGDGMKKKGWSINSLQRPACVHLCVTMKTVANEKGFIKDLQEVVKDILADPMPSNLGGNAAIYGMSGSMPSGPVNELLCCYTDCMLRP